MVTCNSAVTDSSYPAHQALEDVHAMKTTCPAIYYIQSNSNIVAYWKMLHQKRMVSQQFIIHFGKACTKMMAKCLNEHSITYEMLKSTFEDNCDNRQAFDSQLHEWRNKI